MNKILDCVLDLIKNFILCAVMGRSIVIHAEDSGASRVACADIAPFGEMTEVVQYYVLTTTETVGVFK